MNIHKTIICIAIAGILTACIKEEVVLENPTQNNRSLTLAAPLLDISFSPVDVFGDRNLPSGMALLADSSIRYLLGDQLNYTQNFDMELDINGLIGDDNRLRTIDNFNFYFDFRNGLPFTLTCRLDFLNQADEVVASLFTGKDSLWQSPTVDTDGNVASAVTNPFIIEYDNAGITELYNGDIKKAYITVGINADELLQSPNVPNEIVFPNSELIGMKFSVHINKLNN